MSRTSNIVVAYGIVLFTVPQLISCEQKPQPKIFQEYVVRGQVLNRGGDPAEAIDNYRKALELEPNSANVYYHTGGISWGQGVMDA